MRLDRLGDSSWALASMAWWATVSSFVEASEFKVTRLALGEVLLAGANGRSAIQEEWMAAERRSSPVGELMLGTNDVDECGCSLDNLVVTFDFDRRVL